MCIIVLIIQTYIAMPEAQSSTRGANRPRIRLIQGGPGRVGGSAVRIR